MLTLIVGLSRFIDAARASPLHSSLLIVAITLECVMGFWKQRIGRHLFIWMMMLLHRVYHLAFIFNLIDWTPLATSYLNTGNSEIIVNTLLLCGISLLGIPLDFPQTVLSRVVIEAIGAVFLLKVQSSQGAAIPMTQRVLARLALSVAVGFLNDWLRRVYFLKTFAEEQAAESAAGQLTDYHNEKSKILYPSYKPVLRTERAIIRITTRHTSDSGMLAAMRSEATKQYIRAEISSRGWTLCEYSVRPGSIIVEIEAYAPASGDGEETNDDINLPHLMDYGAWLNALKLQEVSDLAEGSMVSVSIGATSHLFSYSKSTDAWTPHDQPNISPLVPAMASLLSRMIPSCTTLTRSTAARDVAFSSIWLEDEPLTIGSLREVGIHLDATMGGLPIPIRLNPTLPRDWKKGQLVNIVVQLPPHCPPGAIRVNLWSMGESSASLGDQLQRPCMVAASHPFLILPSERSIMADEINHLRSSRLPARTGIESLIGDIGRLISFENDCQNLLYDYDHELAATMNKVKKGIEAWCSRFNKMPHTLDFIKSLKLEPAPPADAAAPPATLNAQHTPYPLHLLWLWFNVSRYALHVTHLLFSYQRSYIELAVVVYCALPYFLILARAPPFFARFKSGGLAHWLLVRNVGLLLHLQKHVIVIMTVLGYLMPIRGTPYHPDSPASKRFWYYLGFMSFLSDSMEACESKIAAITIVLTSLPSIFFYGHHVMRFPTDQALVPSLMITVLRLVVLALATGLGQFIKRRSRKVVSLDLHKKSN